MSPLLALAIGLSALGLLLMCAGAALPFNHGIGSSQIFGKGFAAFCISLFVWLIVSAFSFFSCFTGPLHAT